MSEPEDDLDARARSRVGMLLCDKYRLERVLGVGGMATVYAATHRNGHRVAVKMLHPELSLNSEVRTRFRREGHASNSVNHPGTVVVTDDDVAEDGSAFLVMELLDGQSVEELWEESGQHLPPKTVLAIGWELCDVLAAAHQAGIVHRDLKPANLFVTREGRLKVLDFGIARMGDAATRTQTGMVFGTPAFMPPEQAIGRSSQLDGQTDLWAVGATMFTLLSGVVVHQGESSQHVAVLAATQPARSLSTVDPYTDPKLVALVDRALAFEKADRWPTAEAMREGISSVSLELFGNARLALTSVSDTLVAHAPRNAPRKGGTLESPKDGLVLRAVGATTGQPVSSSALTQPQHVSPPMRATLRQRIGAFFDHLRSLFGLRDRGPVSSSDPTLRQTRRALPRTSLLIGGVLALALISLVSLGAALALGGSGDSSTLGQGSSAASGLSVTSPPSSGAPPPVDPIPTPPPAMPASVAVPTASITTPADLPPTREAPKARPIPHPTRPPPAASRRPNCSTDYVMTSDGKKLWKSECL
jgi:serine/threonine-protein kinase